MTKHAEPEFKKPLGKRHSQMMETLVQLGHMEKGAIIYIIYSHLSIEEVDRIIKGFSK